MSTLGSIHSTVRLKTVSSFTMASTCTESKSEEEGNGFLVGKWMNLTSVDGKNGAAAVFYGVHHVNITKHTSQGVVEADLIQTDFFENGKQRTRSYKERKMGYIGVLKDNKLTLNYKDGGYTAAVVLQVSAFSMDGTWYDSTGQKGVNKWIKAYELL